MQKKLIALAVAGLVSGAAFANTNVTIYGVVDAGYVRASGNGLKFSGVQGGILSGSRLGFKGTEDLGNGLKAVFTLEYSLANDVNAGIGNTGGLNARQQFVGLSSNMGTVTLGRQYAPGFMVVATNDALGGSIVSPQSVLSVAGGNTITPNSPARWNNSVAYASPVFSGFQANAIYGFGQTNEITATNDPAFGLGLTYSAGAFRADVVYHNTENTAGVDTKEWYVGGSYDFKVAKLLGGYQTKDVDNTSAGDNKIYNLGVTVPVGKGNVHLEYANLNMKGAGNNDSDSWAIGYTHGLSKRTTLYTFFNRTDNEAAAPAAGVVGAVSAADKSNNTFAVGIRHAF